MAAEATRRPRSAATAARAARPARSTRGARDRGAQTRRRRRRSRCPAAARVPARRRRAAAAAPRRDRTISAPMPIGPPSLWAEMAQRSTSAALTARLRRRACAASTCSTRPRVAAAARRSSRDRLHACRSRCSPSRPTPAPCPAVSAAATSSGVTRPAASTGSQVTVAPRRSSSRTGPSTDACSIGDATRCAPRGSHGIRAAPDCCASVAAAGEDIPTPAGRDGASAIARRAARARRERAGVRRVRTRRIACRRIEHRQHRRGTCDVGSGARRVVVEVDHALSKRTGHREPTGRPLWPLWPLCVLRVVRLCVGRRAWRPCRSCTRSYRPAPASSPR